jgi:glycerol-3-phosphate dehydrogenase
MDAEFDLLIIGGGINGAGIARDAAGRGLKVLLVEQGDLASATSSWSSKLVHGGLRYLEQYEFRLVREALQEREVLLGLAPHLVRPLLFVLPHGKGMRPRWMIRMGMWLYDNLGGRLSLPGSKSVDFPHLEFSAALKPEFAAGFLYSDCKVDDARLVLANAMSAREKGATILTRTRAVSAIREGGVWCVTLEENGRRREVRAKGLVNAAGPWVRRMLDAIEGDHIADQVRLVKGSHLVVPKVHSQGHALILQHEDGRVVFIIPFEGKFSLVGTTDVQVGSIEEAAAITPAETAYLLDVANAFLAKPLTEADVVWSYAGVRPLYDDGSSNPSEVTRDYVLKLDDDRGAAPLLTLFGGKITTYRKLAEHAMEKLAPFYPGLKAPWTAGKALPGGNVHFNAFRDELRGRYRGLPREWVEGIARRHGSLADKVLGEARRPESLGLHFGAGLTSREVDYMVEHEWARTAEDVLWRRSKCGLHMTPEQCAAVATYFATRGT